MKQPNGDYIIPGIKRQWLKVVLNRPMVLPAPHNHVLLLAGHTGRVLEINQSNGKFMVDWGIANWAFPVPPNAPYIDMHVEVPEQ